MKKIVGLFAGLLFAVGMLAGCSVGTGSYHYSNASKYTVGSASVSAADINEISVDWISGDISVVEADTDRIAFAEETDETDSDYLLRYAVIKGELKIKFQKSGTKNKDNFSKNLKVTVPRKTALRELDIESVSGNVEVKDITATEMKIESVSGNIAVSGAAVTKMDFETVSGNIAIYHGGQRGELDLETVSGDVVLSFASPDFRVEYKTVSGKVNNACGATLDRKTYSLGNATVTGEVETVSGNLELRLTETATE